MKWFSHESTASSDSKMKKLILTHGAEGYAVYFHSLELIACDINENHINFELEHDAEIIADNLKIRGTSTQSGRERVEEIMRRIIELNLFQEQDGHIFCLQLAKRITTTQIKNKSLKQIQVIMRQRLEAFSKKIEEKDVKFLLSTHPSIHIPTKKESVFLNDFSDAEHEQIEEPDGELLDSKPHTPWDFQDVWNSFTHLARFKQLRGTVSTTDLEPVRVHCLPYTSDEIEEAIRNYGIISKNPDAYEFVPRYPTLISFLSKGVEACSGDLSRLKRQPKQSIGQTSKPRDNTPRFNAEAAAIRKQREEEAGNND